MNIPINLKGVLLFIAVHASFLIDAIFENVIAYLCAYTDKFEWQLH